MKKLLEIQRQYIAEMERFTKKSIELLSAAKNSLSNHIGSCKVKDCSLESPCNFCKTWNKVWKEIDEYIDD